MFIKIGDNGKLIVVTDIHGNLKLFKKYIKLYENSLNNQKTHIVFAGDLIHGRCHPHEDKSLEILEIIDEYQTRETFHVLLGNHELAEIDSSSYLYRNMVGYRKHFNKCLNCKYGKKEAHLYKEKYYEIIYGFKFALITDNGLWVSHTGVGHRNPEYNIKDFMWNTIEYEDYTPIDVNDFLEHNNLKFMVVGHTEIPKGYQFFGKQLIINSSHHADGDFPNYYLDLDLSLPIDKKLIKKSLKVME